MRIQLLVLGCLLFGCKSEGSPQATQSTEAPAVETKTSAPSPSASQAASAVKKAAPPSGPTEPLNVMLLTVDSMRADMPWTGYERDIAPHLTELAKQSTVYTNAYSASSYTAKSVSTMLTGRYPSSIYRSGWFFAGFPDSNLFFTEVLQQRGVRTMGGHAHMYFDRGKNLDQGFDVWELTPGISFDSETDKHVTGDKLTQLAIDMLSSEKNTKGQFFLWLHYMDPHDQYVKHEQSPDFGKLNRDRYDSEMFFTDLQIKKLLDFAKKQPWWSKTCVMISADHGEAFGEHGMYKHAFELWEVLTHVPWIVYAPGAEAQRIEERRSHIDLAPTVLELMGVDSMPESFQGSSLVKEIYGAESPKNKEPIVLDLPEDKNNPDRHAIIHEDYKLIAHGRGKRAAYFLYNLKTDPGEEKDLRKEDPEKFEEMKQLYEKTWQDLEIIEPFGGMKLRSGRTANGPKGPPEKQTETTTGKKK